MWILIPIAATVFFIWIIWELRTAPEAIEEKHFSVNKDGDLVETTITAIIRASV
jgi:hypothetical protein